jgi:ribose transport system permease protein
MTIRFPRMLSFQNASALWVLLAIVLVFSYTIPETFLAGRTWTSLLDTQATVAIAALALIVPLSAGVFNLAIGAQVGVASIMAGWLLVPIGLPVPLAIVVTLAACAAIGFLIAILIVVFGIDSFIATLGASSLLFALVTFISGGRQILRMPRAFADFGTDRIFGLTYPFLTMLALGVLVWYVLERTPLGRRVYATGGNIEAARLSGVPVFAIVLGSMTVCGLIAGVAGVLMTSRLGNADPTIGPGFMLPAFTAAFLGSTQFHRGRFNVAGAILSVYVLAAGVKGLQLSGVPSWATDGFNGAALLVAVGLAAARRPGTKSLWRRLFPSRRAAVAAPRSESADAQHSERARAQTGS